MNIPEKVKVLYKEYAVEYQENLHDGGDASGGDGGTGGDDEGGDSGENEGNDSEGAKKYTDEEVDTLIERKFAEWQKKHEKQKAKQDGAILDLAVMVGGE